MPKDSPIGERIDLLIETGAMLPMTDESVVYDACVAVREGRIVYAGTAVSAPAFEADRVITDPEAVVLPGLINAHTHVGIHFFGTLCDDGNLITALYHLLFPMEFHLDEEMMFAASSIGLWDAAKGGVTTICDHYHFPDATARAMEEVGLRGLVAGKVIEFELNATPDYEPETATYEIRYVRAEAERRLVDNAEFVERWRGHHLVRPCLGPHAPDTLSTDMLVETARLADQLDVKMMIHIAQSRAELAQVANKGYKGSLRYLDEIGFLSPRVQGAHMVFIDEEEAAIAGNSGMGVSFNPISNIWTRSFSPVDQLIAAGVKVGFGTDALSMDELEEMRFGIYAANHLRGSDDFLLRGYKLLRMATIEGAEALGLADEVGTVEEGKRADLIVLNLRDSQLVPNTNYHESVAYYAKSRNLTHTIVDGKVVYADGRLQLTDEERIYDEAVRLARKWVLLNRDTLEQRGIWQRIQPHFFIEPQATAEKPLIDRTGAL